MEIEDIIQLMQDATQRGLAKAMADKGLMSPLITKADAYRLYGRSNVDRWLAENLISLSSDPVKSSKRFLDTIKLASISAASNRHTYLPVADRKR
jgi:hypothetical protein